MARWHDLPLELHLYVLSFLRFPYLLTLLEVPELGDLLRLDGCKMLNKAHSRLCKELYDSDDVIELEVYYNEPEISSYYDGALRLKHDRDLQVWQLTLQSGDHLYHWVLDCEVNDFAQLIYSKHCYQGKPVSIYYRTVSEYDDTLLRTTYHEGRLAEIFYHNESLIMDGGYSAALHTHAKLKTNGGGGIVGTWEAQLRRGKRRAAVASCTYQSECVTTYYRNIVLALRGIDNDYGPNERAAYTLCLASCLVPSFPLLLAKVAALGLDLPFRRLWSAMACEEISSESSALRSLADDLEAPAWPALGEAKDLRALYKTPRKDWRNYILHALQI